MRFDSLSVPPEPLPFLTPFYVQKIEAIKTSFQTLYLNNFTLE